MALILDTGVVYAAFDRDDEHHLAARGLLDAAEEILVLPSPTLCELDYLLRTRIGPGACLSLIDDVRSGAFVVEDLTFEDYDRARELMDRYDEVGFVDASILAIVERCREGKLATTDRRHFSMMRPRHVEALELLP